jgi:hypothetical protein
MEAELAELTEHGKQIESCADFYEFSTLDYGKACYEFTIDWCRKFIEKSSHLGKAEKPGKRGMKG